MSKFWGFVALLFCLPLSAAAQTWVGEPNTLTSSLGYSYNSANGDWGLGGAGKGLSAQGLAKFYSEAFIVDLDYATPIQGLAVSASLPLILAQFTGPANYAPHGSGNYCNQSGCFVEQGAWRLTDLQAHVRYQLPWHPAGFMITPRVGLLVPVTKYPTIGNTSYGKGLREEVLGLGVGRALADGHAFFDLAYDFAFVDSISDPNLPVAAAGSPNRSEGRLTFGYFIKPNWVATVGLLGRYTYNGYSWTQLVDGGILNKLYNAPGTLTLSDVAYLKYHDPLARERMLMARAGIAYNFSRFSVGAEGYGVLFGDSVPQLYGVTLQVSMVTDLGGG